MSKILFAFLLSSSAGELWLRPGEVRTLPAPTGKAVRIGSRGIIKVIDGQTTVRVVALRPGSTPLLIGETTYAVRVGAASQRDFVSHLRTVFKWMKGLTLDTNASPVSVQGTLLRFSDWRRLADLARRYQGEYVFRAQARPEVAREALGFFTQLARDKGFPVMRFGADPAFTAQIPNTAEDLKEGAMQLFKPYGIAVESARSKLMINPLIRTRVILAEVSREDAIQFGISWPTEFSAQVLPQWRPQNDLMATLHMLENRGKAQILASPNLLCRSGGEAAFHSGGEFPIKIFSLHTHDVVWKRHGVLLNVRPVADFQGAISLEIETEISTLDDAHAVDGIPALRNNTVKSHFDLPGRRTIALSGLIRRDEAQSSEGVPLLSRIPVLGGMFSSQRFLQRETELVIFVTPEVYVPEADEKIEMPAGWMHDGF